ncbi:MAG: hypothetical protein MAG795_00754 [Candidatus Woesearchaeota archaeon]|nr:hypothetical protein [Candidatus Woesearchaeota archaeon]
MVSIAHVVSDKLSKRPFIEEALSRGLINYGALADEMIPLVEATLQKKVKHSAVMMAIRRHTEKINQLKSNQIDFFKNTDLSVRSNLFEVTFQKSSDVHKKIIQLYDIINPSQGDILNIIQGNYEITIISNQVIKKKIIEKVGKSNIIKSFDNLSSVSIRFPIKHINTPGFIFACVKAISWEQINIVEVVSTMTELTFILNERDVIPAFEILKNLISGGNAV